MRDEGGRRFGRYRLMERIGAGGMAVVHRAVVDGPGGFSRAVVVKRIRADLAHDASFAAMLATEARLSALLHHPNIIQVHEYGELDGEHYLAMELVDGRDLGAILRRCRRLARPMPEAAACFVVAELARALAYAHALTDEAGAKLALVHRDVSPSNVMVTPDGAVKLADFGIAKAAERLRDERTRTGTIKGKVFYMSPEQADGRPLDGRSDLFSLGVVLYECLTLERPFSGDTDLSTLRLIREARPAPPSSLRPGLDAEVEAVALKLLARAPEERFQSGDELAAALRPILHRIHGDAAAVHDLFRTLAPIDEDAQVAMAPTLALDEPEPARPPTRAHRRSAVGPRRRILGVAAAVVAAAALIAGALRWVHERSAAVVTSEAAPRTPARAPRRQTVAVVAPRDLSGGASWVAPAVAEMLSSELSAGDKLRVLPGENVDRTRIELALAPPEAPSREALRRLGAVLGADLLVVGAYFGGSDATAPLRLDLRLEDAASGEVLATVTESGTAGDLGDLVGRAGARLRDRLGVGGVAAADVGSVRATLPADPAAARLYAEGLSRLRRMEPLAARDLLAQAATVEPGHALTHSALAAAWADLGYDERALDEARRALALAGPLGRAERLGIEARYRESTREWDRAIDIYRALRTFYPDDLDHGLRLAAAESAAGQSDRAFATLASLRELPPPDGNDPRIDLGEAAAAGAASDYRRQLAAAEAASRRAEARGARLAVARAKAWEGWARRNLGERARAEAADTEALRIYRELHYRLGEAEVLNDLAILRRDAGDLEAAASLYAQALALHREVGRQKGIAQSLNNLAEVSRLLGRVEEARRQYDEALAAARALGDRYGEALVFGNLGELLAGTGELGEAEHVYGEALRGARGLGQKSLVAYLLYDVGELARARADFDGARRAHEEALALRAELGERGNVAESEAALARLALERGDAAAARAGAERAAAKFVEQKNAPGEARARATLALALQSLGRAGDAQREARAASALAAKMEDRASRLDVATAAGRVLRDAETCRRAADEAARFKLVGTELEARLAVADLTQDSRLAASVGREAVRRGYRALALRARAR